MELTKAQEWMLVYSRVFADAWRNNRLRIELKSNPREVLGKKYGFTYDSNVTIGFTVVAETSLKDYQESDFDIFSSPTTNEFNLIEASPLVEGAMNRIPKNPENLEIMCCCCCL